MTLLEVKINEGDGSVKRHFKKFVFSLMAAFVFGINAAIYTLFTKCVLFPLINYYVAVPESAYVPSAAEIFLFAFSVECLSNIVGRTKDASIST